MQQPWPGHSVEPVDTAYPLMRAGGLFLVGAGTFFAVSRLDPSRWHVWTILAFLTGMTLATFGLLLKPSLGPPSGLHWASFGAGLAIEFAGIAWASRRFAGDERRTDLAILFIVGLHFLPMAYAIGPLIAVLGLLCMGLAAFAWNRPHLTTRAIGLVDAGLKLGFGLVLAFVHPIAWPPRFLWS